MKRNEQIALLRTFCNQVRDHLISKADLWPEEWDGHELRSLAARAFAFEETTLMRKDKRRRRDFTNEVIVRNLD